MSTQLVTSKPSKRTNIVDLIPLVSEIYDEFKIRLYQSELSISFEHPINTSKLMVSVHPEEFKRSLSNIINNAVESYSDKEQGCIVIELISTHGFIELAIQDNGCGIPDDKLRDIFLEGISVNKKNGTGLGLSYVENVVKSWGAEYEMTSEVSKGTTFKYIFEDITSKFEKQYVFIDDTIALRQAWELAAASANISLTTFGNSTEFMRVINDFDRDVHIYIDYELGETITGLELSKHIYELGFKNIYLATGYDSSEFESNAWLKGVTSKYPPFVFYEKDVEQLQ